MLIKIVSVGVWKDGPERALFYKYLERLPRGYLELVEVRNQKSKEIEGERILKVLEHKRDVIIALDEHGDELTTRQFDQTLATFELLPKKHLVFVIGGAEGLDQEVLDLSDKRISLGKMTWPHFLVRGLLVEQIYRIYQIRAGHPYHRD